MKTTFVESTGASDTSGTANHALQQILGTDKRNPVFSLFRDPKHQSLHVYYGIELLEVVPENKTHLAFKCLIGRLYNAGVKAKSLQECFGIDRKTMHRWGQALQAEDPQQLIQSLAGRGGQGKLSSEIRSFVAVRFATLYPENRHSYSKQIRDEIQRVFDVSLSGEALRPLFKQLKSELKQEMGTDVAVDVESEKRETACEKPLEIETQISISTSVENSIGSVTEMDSDPIHKQSPVLCSNPSIKLCHHVGVLVFSSLLERVEQQFVGLEQIFKQWLASLLLGAVNIEQTKLLDFEDLNRLLSQTTQSLYLQRCQLSSIATDATVVTALLGFNGKEVNVETMRDFYFDPHTKHYTGSQNLLKGWCSRIRFADKVMHTDFIHSTEGCPVFLGWSDNYQDIRQRFFQVAESFRTQVGLAQQVVVTLIADRGVFSHSFFKRIVEAPHYHIVTWEKNYQRGQWDALQKAGSFVLERARNHAQDKRCYHFEYMDRDWSSDPSMRQLVVRATNPKNKTVELGILTDDRKRPAQLFITWMFSRWIQENDFKYLDKHFGINEITSYASVSYEKLKSQLEDKQIQSGADKALQEQQSQVKQHLSRLLLGEHRHPRKSAKRSARIIELTEELKQVEQKRTVAQKEVSRLESLVEQQMCRLDTRNKSVMDCLKVIARNAFYRALQPFKEAYNNYRDDHELFRNLTQCDGVLVETDQQVDAYLLPTVNYAPKLEKIITQVLQQINTTDPKMPDGSKRQLRLHLAKKEGIQLAMASAQN